MAHERVAQAVDNGFRVTSDTAQAANADVIIICVPTPLGKHQEPDLSFVIGTMDAIVPLATWAIDFAGKHNLSGDDGRRDRSEGTAYKV